MAQAGMIREQTRQDGFVLPYVLVVIFILALTSAIAVRSLTASGQIITELNANMLGEQRLASAEADTVFVFLTSAGVKGGIDTSHTPWSMDDAIDGFDVSKLAEGAIWSAAGGGRLSAYSSGDVLVQYRDVTGLVPINRDAPEMLGRLFKGLGLRSDDSKSAAAKLGDYIDKGNRRRFRGAERADYRMKFTPPPANAPLRVHAEMYHILGWDKLITPLMYERLRKYTTLTTSNTYYRTAFLSPELAKVLGLAKLDEAAKGLRRKKIDFLDYAVSTIETPTQQGRFVFSTPKITGKVIVRTVELKRTPNAAGAPFQRTFVFEETRDAGDDSRSEYTQDGRILPVFSTPDRDEQ
jgi:hypothetical protein